MCDGVGELNFSVGALFVFRRQIALSVAAVLNAIIVAALATGRENKQRGEGAGGEALENGNVHVFGVNVVGRSLRLNAT